MQEGFERLNDPRLSGHWKELSGAIVCVLLTVHINHNMTMHFADFARSSLYSLLNVRSLPRLCISTLTFLAPDISNVYVERLSETQKDVSTNDEQASPSFTPYHDEPEDPAPVNDIERSDVPIFSPDDPSISGGHSLRSSRLIQKRSRRSSIIGHHRFAVIPRTPHSVI